MDLAFVFTIFLIGFIGSFFSGMLGIGGAIINYPMLLCIPALLGFTGLNAYETSGIVAVQVFFSTLSGILVYRKDGYINKSLIITMGGSILIGSFAGGYGSYLLTEQGINLVYGILAVTAAIIMFFPKKKGTDIRTAKVKYNKWLAAVLASIVGVGAGVVGAGGAFLLVPVMLVVLKIPTRITIATSMAVTFISSIGTTLGKVVTDQVIIIPALVIIAASIIASPIGAKVGKQVNVKLLQGILAVLIMVTALKIWIDFLT